MRTLCICFFRRLRLRGSPVFSSRSCSVAPGFALHRLYMPLPPSLATEHCILIRSDLLFFPRFRRRFDGSDRQAETSNGEGKKRPAAKRKHGCSGRRTRRRMQAASSAIQRLFLACKTVFKGPGTVPEPADVEKLQLLLDKMGPEDVGLSTDILFFREEDTSKKTSRITYATIYKCDNFSMCIFFLPQAAVIPLHDHPGMTVFSKLLLGSMHIKSYDWLDPTTSSNSRAAKLIVDSDFTAPCNASVLYPTTGGNIHAFTAIAPCAVLDVLGPPYSKEDGRDITYYRDCPDTSASGQNGEKDYRVGWLEEVDISKELKMDGVEYLGPKVIR